MIAKRFVSYVAFAAGVAIGLSSPMAMAQDRADEAGSAGDQAISDESAGNGDLLDLSLEELLSRQVTSAAKKSQSVADTAAAIYVIDKEQIASSSARTLTDLFRMVPGFQVAEVQGSGTAVSARGFSTRYAANILVMVDGAAIYGSGITGIFWDQAIFPLQDIERIEVIRGPGGSLWGSNSINGVINIITKQGIDAQGIRARVQAGKDQQRVEINVGKVLSDSLAVRAYGTYRHNVADDFVDDTIYRDDWSGGLAGVRLDLAPTAEDKGVLLGEYSEGRIEDRFVTWELDPYLPVREVMPLRNRFRSAHVLGRWQHSFSADLDVTAQAYYNYLSREEWGGEIERRLYDISVEGRWRASATHEFNFGVAGRIDVEGGRVAPGSDFVGSTHTDRQVTGYVQDDITIVPDRLRLTLGSKFEQNNFTGFNAQPSARLLFKATPDHSLWASYSRAVRTPLLSARQSIIQYGLYVPYDDTGIPYFFDTRLLGNPDSRNETLDAFEIGARGKLGGGWTYDLAGFVNKYRELSTLTVTGFDYIFVPPVTVPLGADLYYAYTNLAKATTYGFELTVAGRPAPRWRVEASWSYLNESETVAATPLETLPVAPTGLAPHHQLRLRSTFEVSDKFELSGFVHYAGPSADGSQQAYTALNFKATWSPTTNFEVSLIGNNLLDARRVEYRQDILPIPNVYVEREVSIEAKARF